MKQLHKMQNAVHNINPLCHEILMQVLHTFLYAFPKMLTRRICHTYNQGRLGFAIIFFILITFMFDSGVIMLGEIRCQSLLRAKGFTLDLGACFLSHIQNQGYIQNSLFFCFSGLLESYKFCSKFQDFYNIKGFLVNNVQKNTADSQNQTPALGNLQLQMVFCQVCF